MLSSTYSPSTFYFNGIEFTCFARSKFAGLGAKERKLWRMVTCLINRICKSQLRDPEQGTIQL